MRTVSYTHLDVYKRQDYGIPVPDYVEENVSTKVVKIIQSYTGAVSYTHLDVYKRQM